VGCGIYLRVCVGNKGRRRGAAGAMVGFSEESGVFSMRESFVNTWSQLERLRRREELVGDGGTGISCSRLSADQAW
jgi:hypothetical protein